MGNTAMKWFEQEDKWHHILVVGTKIYVNGDLILDLSVPFGAEAYWNRELTDDEIKTLTELNGDNK